MKKITTADCKKFLANYFKNNVTEIEEEYSDTFENNFDHVVKLGTNPGEWIREWKSSPTSEGMSWWSSSNGFWTTEGEKTFDEITAVRCFTLAPEYFDTLIRYLVIEGKDGNLYLGSQVGE